jgi:Pyruvate/2-oxoacid:ferredoxin oxidoreductase delta subunit
MCIGPKYADGKLWKYLLKDSVLWKLNAIIFYMYFKHARVCKVVLNFQPSELNRSAVDYCDCRIAGHNCNNPVDSCLKIDSYGKTDYKKLGYEIRDNNVEISNKLRNNGLLLLRVSSTKRFIELCHCCSCCCIPLIIQRLLIRSGLKYRAISPSDYYPVLLLEKCDNCRACIKVCPLNDGTARDNIIRSRECLGCGLCALQCSKNAIKMKKRPTIVKSKSSTRFQSLFIYYFTTIYLLFQSALFKISNPVVSR